MTKNNKNNILQTVVIGDIMLDKYVYGTVERVSPESCCPILKETSYDYQLGGAANVAKQLKRLGEDVILIGIIGSDQNGEHVKAILKQENINCSFLVSTGAITICKTRYINHLRQQMFRKDSEVPLTYTPKEEQKIIEYISKSPVNSIVISDYNKGTISKSLCKNIICLANKLGINVIVDIKETDINKYQGASVVKGNKKEIERLLDQIPHKENIEEALAQLRIALNTRYLVMTCGEDGILAIDNNKTIIRFPSQKQTVHDVTGAGDIVTSYLSYLSNKKELSFDQILYYSNKAANIKVERFGNSYVGINEVMETSSKLISATEFNMLKLGGTIVFTNGCFDIIHAGHIDLLQKAKKEGNILVVGLNSDESIKRIKGNNRPINSLDLRIQMLSAIQYVDYIIVFNEDTPIKIIEAIKPNVLVKGGDYKLDNIVGADYISANGGRVLTIPFIHKVSTTHIINKIKQ